jgi:hypothetical protein
VTILPLIGRELLVRARSPAVYWMRFAVGLAGVLLCLPALDTFSGSMFTTAQSGRAAFDALIVFAFLLCCGAGFLTVDAISRERREGTLKLLLLTRVTALDALLGKFGAAGITCLCALIAFVPVIVLPVLAGGVTGGEAARKVLVLFDTMVLSVAAGLWASAGAKGWLQSARVTVLLLLLFVVAPLLGDPMLPSVPHVSFSPVGALLAAGDANYRTSAVPYWLSILAGQAISCLLLLSAGIRLRRALRREDEPAASSALSRPPPAPLAAGADPIEWLLRRQRGMRAVVWAGVALYLFSHSGYFSYVWWRRTFSTPLWYSQWGVSLACNIAESCLFAWVASRFLMTARHAGELELLLTTPAGATALIASQWKWLKRLFRWPVIILLSTHIFSLVAILAPPWPARFFSYPMAYIPYSVLSSLLGCFQIIMHVAALLWVGLWFGWRERSQARAIAWTVLLATGVPYLIYFFGSAVIPAITVSSTSPRSTVSLNLIPQVGALLYYLWLVRSARRRLSANLQHIERFRFDWSKFARRFVPAHRHGETQG